jgi:hypothetical protein
MFPSLFLLVILIPLLIFRSSTVADQDHEHDYEQEQDF